MKTAEIHTEKGIMKVDLYEKDAPNTVANFVKLSKSGFYDGLTFHRIIPNFVIQGGCPDGTGAGGPGYSIKCELEGDNQYHDRGVLSMAHAGRDTGGSQFFICHSRDNTSHLDRNHTCFGKVYEGLEVIDDISQGDTIEKIFLPNYIEGKGAVVGASVVVVCSVFYELWETADIVKQGNRFGKAGFIFIEVEFFGEVEYFTAGSVGVVLL